LGVQEKIHGWFVHPAGFLSEWGVRNEGVGIEGMKEGEKGSGFEIVRRRMTAKGVWLGGGGGRRRGGVGKETQHKEFPLPNPTLFLSLFSVSLISPLSHFSVQPTLLFSFTRSYEY
jgi:hypothetical protein